MKLLRPAQVLPWLPMPPAQPALTSWSSAASCAPATLGPAGGPPAQVCTLPHRTFLCDVMCVPEDLTYVLVILSRWPHTKLTLAGITCVRGGL